MEILQTQQEAKSVYHLGYRIKLLSQLLNRRLQALLEPFGLTAFQWEVLCCLWKENGVPTSTLSEQLQQLGGTLTGVLDVMEKRGLVRRERDSQDRRIWRVWLTDDGEQLKQVLPSLVNELKEETFACLSPKELQQLSNLIDKVMAHVS